MTTPGEFLAQLRERCARNAELSQSDPDAIREQMERERKDLHERTARHSVVPPLYANVTLDGLAIDANNRRGIYAARAIVANEFSGGLGLYGAVGVGKTTIACGIANAAIAAGKAAKMLRPERLFARLHEARRFGSEASAADVIDDLAATPVLILDDFGSESVDRQKLAWLAEVLDARMCAHGGVLVITANGDALALHARYIDMAARAGDPERGDAIMDRVRALTGAWVKIEGTISRRPDGGVNE